MGQGPPPPGRAWAHVCTRVCACVPVVSLMSYQLQRARTMSPWEELLPATRPFSWASKYTFSIPAFLLCLHLPGSRNVLLLPPHLLKSYPSLRIQMASHFHSRVPIPGASPVTFSLFSTPAVLVRLLSVTFTVSESGLLGSFFSMTISQLDFKLLRFQHKAALGQ